jgi:hypothetical protein
VSDETIDVGYVHVLGEDGYCTGDCPHPDHHFTCESCGHTFRKAWTDAEANREYAERYGPDALDTDGQPTDDTGSVCDTCYPKVLAWARSEGLIP